MNTSLASPYTLAENIKGAEVLFKKLGIDIEQMPKYALVDILKQKNISLAPVLKTLSLLQSQPEADAYWLLNSASVLIDHIKNFFHNHHRQQLPRMISLAEKIEQLYADNSLCPKGLSVVLKEFHTDLLVHMEKEEQVIFPLLLENKTNYIYCEVGIIMHNHDHHLVVLNQVMDLTHQCSLSGITDENWRELYQQLIVFDQELREHIRLENEILFAGQ